jgi:uncharacterized protein (TIGR02265 family)
MSVSDIAALRSPVHETQSESWMVSTQGPISIAPWESWASLAARISVVPSHGQVRGMFVRQARAWLPATASARYLPFANYSMREYMETLLKAAARRYPRESPGSALVHLGLDVYPTFASSLVGGTIFGIANNVFQKIVELSPKAYPLTLTPGAVTVLRSEAASARVELRDVWVFPEFFHAGVWLGAMQTCRMQGTIKVTRRSPCDVDFDLQWTPSLN